ncbi:MAG: hypothetical protein V4857_07820 [Pseudomonadota bacterium]
MQLKRRLTQAACLAAVASAVIACTRMVTAPAPATLVIDPIVADCNITNQDTPITPALLAAGVPCEVMATAPFDSLAHLQMGFDYYSWLTFLGLNAPAKGGPIGSGPMPGGDAPAAWEGWKEISEVMLKNGARPSPWNSARSIPAVCQGLGGGKLLSMVGKTATLLEDTNQPFDTGPLIDQNGNYARYEILVNEPMFNYIVQNRLYSKTGQAGFTSAVDFPAGTVIKGTSGTMGALMVKAAWKVMGAGDDPARFHTTTALLYTAATADGKVGASCVKSRMGLVGLHVAHKTLLAPQWIWSTFEHRANVPGAGAPAGAHYNFNNPACKGNCAVNQPPPRPWNPNVQPFPNGFTSQITRFTPITPEVEQLNARFQRLLPGKVWSNYDLVSTQWPTAPGSKTDPNGVPAPVFLANTTMETYIQGKTPQSSSSCMACHGNAAGTSGRKSDFTYILERAN